MMQIIQENWLLLLVGQYPHGPLGGLVMTLVISIISLLATLPISLLMALAMVSRKRWIALPVWGFVQVMRGIPFLMLLFWTYFALPLLWKGEIGAVHTLIATLVLYKSAYVAEIIKGGIEALPKGQFEACHALGLGYVARYRKIILPQVIYNTLPSMVTQFVGIVKDTSIGYVISAPELSFAANQLNAFLMTKPLEVFGLVAIVYFGLNYALTSLAKYLERRMERARQSQVPAQTNQGVQL